jgi:hypothetical protein
MAAANRTAPHRRVRKHSPVSKPTSSKANLFPELREIAFRLKGVYATCVTAELALQGQNAEQDHDILLALRLHVSEPVSRQVERLEALLASMARTHARVTS